MGLCQELINLIIVEGLICMINLLLVNMLALYSRLVLDRQNFRHNIDFCSWLCILLDLVRILRYHHIVLLQFLNHRLLLLIVLSHGQSILLKGQV